MIEDFLLKTENEQAQFNYDTPNYSGIFGHAQRCLHLPKPIWNYIITEMALHSI
jgi:hypothetical protein